MAAISPTSISAVCESLEQIAQADSKVSGINAEMLQHLGETISLAMETLAKTVEQQISNGGGTNGVHARELISHHSSELVQQPISADVSEAVKRIREVTSEVAEVAIDQRVAIGREHPDLAPRVKRVVVVDDDVTAQQELVLALEKCECQTTCFRYGGDFADELDKVDADIIMLDLTLPDMPAFHLIKKIKDSNSLAHAKLFVLAQPGDNDKIQVVLGMGVDEVIMKPIDEQMMAFKLRHY